MHTPTLDIGHNAIYMTLYCVRCLLYYGAEETNLLLGHGRGGKRPDVKVNARLPHRRTRTARNSDGGRRRGPPSQGTTRSIIQVPSRISLVQNLSDNMTMVLNDKSAVQRSAVVRTAVRVTIGYSELCVSLKNPSVF